MYSARPAEPRESLVLVSKQQQTNFMFISADAGRGVVVGALLCCPSRPGASPLKGEWPLHLRPHHGLPFGPNATVREAVMLF